MIRNIAGLFLLVLLCQCNGSDDNNDESNTCMSQSDCLEDQYCFGANDGMDGVCRAAGSEGEWCDNGPDLDRPCKEGLTCVQARDDGDYSGLGKCSDGFHESACLSDDICNLGLICYTWSRYYWLNLVSLVENLLRDDQQLVEVKYFTTRISSRGGNTAKFRRQATYLEALDTLPNLQTFYGHYLSKQVCCHSCGVVWDTTEEKMTDVQIAIEMLTDAYSDTFDTAIVISGDSDLAPPIGKIRNMFPTKRVCPPRMRRGDPKACKFYWLHQ